MDPELPTPAAAAAAPTAVPFASSPPLPALQQQQPAPDNAINGHPPYAVMIKTALTSMKEKAGSSKKAIAKYIERNYSNLPPTHSALLGTHLRRLKKSGALEMVRKSYKLTSNVNGGGGSAVLNSAVRSAGLGSGLVGNGAGTSASGSKRPRGRPPKVKVEAEADSAAAAAQAAAQPMLVALGLADEPKKSRGRPKKNVVGGEGSSGAVSGTVTASGEKRRPGRPPRDKSAVKEMPKGVEPNRGQGKKAIGVPVMIPYAPEPVATGAGTVNLPTPGGGVGGPAVAPPNSGTVGGANYVGVAGGAVSASNIGVYHVGVAGVPKRRGRPKKETAETGAGVGAGSGSVAGVGSGAAIGGDLPRRRGRPPRVAKVVVAPVKKRGRPQRTNKAAEIPKKKRGRPPVAKWVQKLGKSTGRHMGRPRKIVSTEAGNSQAAASRDLMRKLDYFQSKIKEAVLKLRPHMPSESVEAVAAIQELEIHSALYHPLHGYFSQRSRSVGVLERSIKFNHLEGRKAYMGLLDNIYKKNDISWFTPVELFKPWYAHGIAEAILRTTNLSVPLKIYEIGGGSGTCAKGIMDYIMLNAPARVYNNMQYISVEISSSLAEIQRETVGEVRSHSSKFRVECRDASDRSQWGSVEHQPCWVIMLEVLDNLQHDLIYSKNQVSPWMEVWVDKNENGITLSELYKPLKDPLIKRCMDITDLESNHSTPGAVLSMTRSIWSKLFPKPQRCWLPTGCLKLLEVLHEVLPKMSLIASDFSFLPDVRIPGERAPLVSTKKDGSSSDYDSYLDAKGDADIFFPTDFWLLERMDHYCSGWKDFSKDNTSKKGKKRRTITLDTSSFMEEFGLPSKTRTKDGYNPLLDDFKNTKFYLSVPTHNIK